MSPRRVRVIRAAAAAAAVALVVALGAVIIDRPGTYYGRVNVVLVPPGATNPMVADNPLSAGSRPRSTSPASSPRRWATSPRPRSASPAW